MKEEIKKVREVEEMFFEAGWNTYREHTCGLFEQDTNPSFRLYNKEGEPFALVYVMPMESATEDEEIAYVLQKSTLSALFECYGMFVCITDGTQFDIYYYGELLESLSTPPTPEMMTPESSRYRWKKKE